MNEQTRALRRQGRPPYDWLMWSTVQRLSTGTALVIDPVTRAHAPRVVGRLVHRDPTELTLRRRDGRSVVVRASSFRRARIVSGLFDREDFVVKRGVHSDDWRGVVLETVEQTCKVQTRLGVEWLPEEVLEHADDRERDYALSLPRMKPGPVASDSVVEATNQVAYEERGERWAG